MLLRRCMFLCLFLASGVLTASLAAQTDFKTVVVFGDSLSDTGNIANLVQHANVLGLRYPGDNTTLGFDYTDGRFTDGTDTQPAAQAYFGVWIEQLAASLPSHPAVKDSLDGGTNYAYGDATTGNGTTTESQTVDLIPVSITLNNMGRQVTDYLATNPTPNAGTLYVLWGGANDLYQAATAGGNPTTAAATAVANELALVQQLIGAGARNFMIPNLPPLGGVPAYATTPNAMALNAASAAFAVALAQGINTVKMTAQAQGITLTVYQPDILTLFGTLAGNPASAGLFNVTAAAQNITFDPDTYLIWDGLHPTTTGHHLAAAAAANLLTPLVGSSTALTSPAVAVAGQTITFSAKVSPGSGTGTPTGGVTFFVASNGLGAPLNASATATATYQAGLVTEGTTTVTAGTYSVTAVYAGDTAYNSSASAAQPLMVLATAVGTTTTLSSSSTNAGTGQSVTFTATVTPAVSTYGAATGTVSFLDGTATLGTGSLNASGVATYTTSTLGAGTHSITASYPVSGIFGASTSAAVSEVVTVPGFTASASPTSLTLASGSSGTVQLTVVTVGGFSGTVTPACGALPAHFSCAIALQTVPTPAGTSIYTLTIATNAAGTVAPAARLAGLGSRTRTTTVAVAFSGAASLLLIGLRRRKLATSPLWLRVSGMLLLVSILGGVSGCGGGSSNNASRGTYPVPVVFTPGAVPASSPAVSPQTVTITVTVQ